MKCTFCRKEIDECNEEYEVFTVDGDFIHTNCIPAASKEMAKICSMSDEEFITWMMSE
jgi:hypothetical protein